jgi:lysozyme
MDTPKILRAAVVTAALTAAGYGGIIAYEGWEGVARPPVQGDVPTVGFGSTRHADGQPVQAGETITPPAAVRLSRAHIAKDESRLKTCFGPETLIAPHEWDAFVSLAYNVGVGNVCASTIPRRLRAGDYAGACAVILDFGKYCSQPRLRKAAGKSVCPPGALHPLPGLAKRRERDYRMCLGEGNAD